MNEELEIQELEEMEEIENVSEVEAMDEPSPGPTAGVLVPSPRPFLETPIDDYTVEEGLLLSIFLAVFLLFCSKIIKEAFTWL